MDNLEQALLESENSLMLLSDEELITPINDILIINPETRLIEVPDTELLLGVFGENLAEKKYFKCPRIVLNNMDLYECFIFINYVSASGRIGSIQSENVELDETEQYILFDWDLTNNVFDKNEDSTIYFSVSAKQYLEDSEPVFATRKAQGKMYETINGTEHVTQEHADIILQILAGMKTKIDLPKDEDGNLLVPEEGQTLLFKEDGTTYYGTPSIGGGTSFSGSAKDVTYDDTETKLGAENVQDAIGKLSKENVDHEADETVHVTESEKQAWNDKEASGTAQTKVSEHNTSETSHNDIRLLIEGLTTRLNTIANSDDVSLDQIGELVAYIKNNKSLIDGITTNKVNVSDIVDNLATSVSNRPLSAKQGVALKALIDGCVKSVNGKTAENGEVTIHANDIMVTLSDPIEGTEEEVSLGEHSSELATVLLAFLDPVYAEALGIVVSAPVVGDVTNATITIGDETYNMIEFAQSVSDALSTFSAGIASTYCTKSEMKNWVAQEIAKIPTTSYENGNGVSY